jgi:hypothetical protein
VPAPGIPPLARRFFCNGQGLHLCGGACRSIDRLESLSVISWNGVHGWRARNRPYRARKISLAPGLQPAPPRAAPTWVSSACPHDAG